MVNKSLQEELSSFISVMSSFTRGPLYSLVVDTAHFFQLKYFDHDKWLRFCAYVVPGLPRFLLVMQLYRRGEIYFILLKVANFLYSMSPKLMVNRVHDLYTPFL